MAFSGKLYPDQTFSLGAVPRAKKRQADKEYDRALEQQEPTDLNGVIDWYEGTTSIGGEFRSTSEAPPLFIKAPKSSPTKRGTYGKHGITGFGRRVVRNSSLLLERRYGKRRLGFVTCTCPAFPAPVQRLLNGLWGEVVRRFYQKLKRQLKKISKPFVYVGVTEIQEKRFATTGIPVPHLHFVYLCRSGQSSRYWLYVCQIHRAWNEALREGIGLGGYPYTMSELPGWGSVHCQTVRKSASSYLGKYISKGCKVLESMKEQGWTEFPKQWWTASMQMKKMFAESIVHLDTHLCSDWFYNLGAWMQEGVIVRAAYISANIGGIERDVGLVGSISKEAYRLLAAPQPVL